MTDQRHVTVVGAGIVGLCTALQLLGDGHRVTLIDPRIPGTATSFGNAGSISTSALIPYSTPGLWSKLPWMLSSSKSPLRLPWRHWHRSVPWLVQFLAAGASTKKIEHHAAAVAPIIKRTVLAHRQLMRRHNVEAELVRPAGWLTVYKQKADVDLNSLQFEMAKRHDVEIDVLDADELQQLEPALSREFQVGVFNKDDEFAVHPIALSRSYFEAFLRAGGEMRHETVRRFEFGAEGPNKMFTDLGVHDIDRLVICAGAWSRELARELGAKIPVEAERGYHINIPWPDDLTLNRPVVVADGYYVMCPMRDGVRITSGAEFGGTQLPPDFRRIRRILDDARQSLPGLHGTPNREWMGWRPSLPDSRPVIGRSPKFRNVVFAFGHGHLGLTLSAVTSEIVSEMINEQAPSYDLSAFRADRF